MANHTKTEINIGTLSKSQRDALLAQLLQDRTREENQTVPTPQTARGRHAYCKVHNALMNMMRSGRISEAIASTEGEVSGWYDQALSSQIEELSHSVAEEVLLEVTAPLVWYLDNLRYEPDVTGTFEFGNEIKEDLVPSVDDFFNSDAFDKLHEEFEQKLPALVHDSVYLEVDTFEMREFLTERYNEFVQESVLPMIAQGICNAEAEQVHPSVAGPLNEGEQS